MTDLNHQDPAQRSKTGSFPHAVVGENPLDELSQSQQLSSASSYTDLNYLFGVQDQTMIAPKSNRNRRKSSQGAEHTKHRRTRSGCYTCRSRRVKVYMKFSSDQMLADVSPSVTRIIQFARVRAYLLYTFYFSFELIFCRM